MSEEIQHPVTKSIIVSSTVNSNSVKNDNSTKKSKKTTFTSCCFSKLIFKGNLNEDSSSDENPSIPTDNDTI